MKPECCERVVRDRRENRARFVDHASDESIGFVRPTGISSEVFYGIK